ncbi:hypothetical protein D3C87_1902420 [compost metagenome]
MLLLRAAECKGTSSDVALHETSGMRLGVGAADCRKVNLETLGEPALWRQSITSGDIASFYRQFDRVRNLKITRLAVRTKFREPLQHFTIPQI